MPEDLVAERIKAVRAHFGQSQRGMADSLGVSVGALQGWELGRSVPNLRAIAKFVYLGVSADWLATGEGAMLRGVGDSEGGGVKGGGPKPTTSYSEGMQRALLDGLEELGLGPSLLWSKRSGIGPAWEVLVTLKRVGPCSFETLSESLPGWTVEALAADLDLLSSQKLAVSEGGEWRVDLETILLPNGLIDHLQTLKAAVQVLSKRVLPACSRGDRTAWLGIGNLQIPKHQAREAITELRALIRDWSNELDTPGGEEDLWLVMGVSAHGAHLPEGAWPSNLADKRSE